MEEVVNPTPEPAVRAPEPPSEASAAATTSPDAPAPETDIERLQAEKQELWDRFLRKQAEFENFRRRAAREKEEILQFAAMETVRGLLGVLDDFDRALKSPPGADEEYRRGIGLIHKRLYDTLAQAGLAPIEAAGHKFDPHFHQAVDTVKQPDCEDHTVVEEYQRGYRFQGRLLRPAMVKVAVRE